MASMMEKNCKSCGKIITVRVADHRRGWGNFCSKSCKAIKQEQRTGQHAAYRSGNGVSNLGTGPMAREMASMGHHWSSGFDDSDPGWDAHKSGDER